MKKTLFLLFAFCGISLLSYANVNKRYTMRPRTQDQLYFLLPTQLPSTQKQLPLEFDMTYLTSDSCVTVRANFLSSEALSIDSVQLINAHLQHSVDSVVVLYVEKEKKAWLHRLEYRLPFGTLEQFYQADESFQLLIHGSGHTYSYAFKPKHWKKEHEEISEILTIITKNKWLK